MLWFSIGVLFAVAAVSTVPEVLGQGVSCGRTGADPECLDVFTHAPNNLPKCYCTELCADKLEELRETCASGQLLADGCGSCLVCARARGNNRNRAHFPKAGFFGCADDTKFMQYMEKTAEKRGFHCQQSINPLLDMLICGNVLAKESY